MSGQPTGGEEIGLECESVTRSVIGAAIEVHRALGPGLLERAYERCLAYEIAERGLDVRSQVELPVAYKGVGMDCGYRLDLVVADRVLVELKSVDSIAPIHEAQLITYLRLSGLAVGLLINFNVRVLKNGIVRRANTRSELRGLRGLRGKSSGDPP